MLQRTKYPCFQIPHSTPQSYSNFNTFIARTMANLHCLQISKSQWHVHTKLILKSETYLKKGFFTITSFSDACSFFFLIAKWVRKIPQPACGTRINYLPLMFPTSNSTTPNWSLREWTFVSYLSRQTTPKWKENERIRHVATVSLL